LESELDEQWMRQALVAAREAQAIGEVPIGVCIVRFQVPSADMARSFREM